MIRYALIIFAGCCCVYALHRLTAPNKQTILPPLQRLLGKRKDKA